MTQRPELVVGLMSGTSLDGIDAALVRFDGPMRARLLGFVTRAYTADERAQVLRAIDGASARDFALLHAKLAEWSAEAVDELLASTHTTADQLDLISFPGQTIWHEPPAVTWQLGEPSILAERFGVRVVHNFRSRDVAAGGQGAPLVPIADVLLWGDADGPRALLNIGGMANVTYVGQRGEEQGAFAFDTGPGMAIIDAVAAMVDPSQPIDRDGIISRHGYVNADMLAELLADPWFAAAPPKSTGREKFGAAYARALHARVPGPDGVATAVVLTGLTIANAIDAFLPAGVSVVVSGGGAHHPGVIEVIEHQLTARRGFPTQLQRFSDLFFSGDAKEAVAFALLGLLALHGQPGNLPAVTGARGQRVLGSITPA